jgi:hypothetical protein
MKLNSEISHRSTLYSPRISELFFNPQLAYRNQNDCNITKNVISKVSRKVNYILLPHARYINRRRKSKPVPVITHHAMKTYGRTGGIAPCILSSALDKVGWSVSHTDRINPGSPLHMRLDEPQS